MATWYVKSGSTGTGSGTSWANASNTIALAIANSAAGDDFDVANTHAETGAPAVTLIFKGTALAPNRIFSTTTANAPATANDLKAGASVSVTGSSNAVTVNGYLYCYGLTFNAGSGASPGSLAFGAVDSEQTYDTCAFNLKQTSGTAGSIAVGVNNTGVSSDVKWINCTYSTTLVGTLIKSTGNLFTWKDTIGAVVGTPPNNLISLGRGGTVIFDGLDLSNMGGGGKDIVAVGAAPINFQAINCITNATVTKATPANPGSFYDFINCDSGATGYKQERYAYAGTLTANSIVTLSGGATDGVQPISWQITTTANSEPQSPLESFQIGQWWNAGLGSSHTATMQVFGPAGLTNRDVWMETSYLGNASVPLASLISSAPATLLSSNSALSTVGTGSWSGTTGNAYTISTSFTPQMAGFVRVVVKASKPSITVYVDPKVVII